MQLSVEYSLALPVATWMALASARRVQCVFHYMKDVRTKLRFDDKKKRYLIRCSFNDDLFGVNIVQAERMCGLVLVG